MKVRPACAAVVSIGTALLLLSGIRCAQAAEISDRFAQRRTQTRGSRPFRNLAGSCSGPRHRPSFGI